MPVGDRVLGQKDLKQAEARVVAYLSRAQNLIRVFDDPNASLYIDQWRLAFGQEIKKDTPAYTLCKAGIHACHYDEGPLKLAWDTGLSVRETTEFQRNYHAVNPEIRQWHEATVEELATKGYLDIPFYGKSRVFYEALSFYRVHRTFTDRHKKDAYAWRPQTLVPQIITEGLRMAWPRLPDSVWIHHHGHDSVTWSCRPQEFIEVERLLDQCLDVRIPINGLVLQIPRDTAIGYSVGDLMEYKGAVPSVREWEAWRAKKQRERRRLVLEGIYGPHIERGV